MQEEAYTVEEFTKAYKVSTSRLYELWQCGEGPRYYRVPGVRGGRRTAGRRMISRQAAEEWQRNLEKLAS